MRLIDVDALPEGRVEWEDIVNAPTIDAVSKEDYDKLKDLCEQYKYERDVLEDVQRNKVEVVRCKDCKHRDNCYKEIAIRRYDKDIECHYPTFEKLAFCSFGERKEEK